MQNNIDNYPDHVYINYHEILQCPLKSRSKTQTRGRLRKEESCIKTKMACSLWDWDEGWRKTPYGPGWDSQMSCQVLIQFSQSLTHSSRQTGVLLMHSAVDIFPACLPSSFFPLSALTLSPSLFQPIRHDSTSWLLAYSQPEDINCVCEYVCGWGCQHILCPYFWWFSVFAYVTHT